MSIDPLATPQEPGQPVQAAAAEDKKSTWREMVHAMSPKAVWSWADGYPVVLKQFIQFCLVIVYPAWVVGVLFGLACYGLFYVTVYPVLWLLFWPMRAWMKKNRPEEYAESQRKK